MKEAQDYTLVDYNNIVKQFHDEPDGSAAILAACITERFSEKLLRRFLREHPHTDSLFKGYGPLSTFSARCNVAYALGIIDDVMHRDLHFIRKVRNCFAHHPDEAGFDESPVKDLCQKLSTNQLGAGARDSFLFAIGLTVGQMHNIILKRDNQEANKSPKSR
ncbi:MAG: MltR family transcriptional regulator [Planctomycetota bacterium]